ncbi:MAG: hypothetical protein JWO95_2456 [Verrucomicrobiales bacterium]|nr:hypothetical protein [Verrucomicrobiales bacterium]
MTLGVILLLFGSGLWAGTQNALAGGGSFVTLPALMLSGLDARAANITSTIALFPGQVTTGWAGRKGVTGTERLSFKAFFIISLIGGVVGAILLLLTPPSFFARLVPWLVLFATSIFAWGSFFRKQHEHEPVSAAVAGTSQFLIAIYGGYFGGGIGFLMLAALTFAGLKIRAAGATKNVLAAVMNASAVVIFLFSKEIAWLNAVILGIGAIIGGLIGAHLLQRVNERALRIGIVVLGLALTVGLFLRQ